MLLRLLLNIDTAVVLVAYEYRRLQYRLAGNRPRPRYTGAKCVQRLQGSKNRLGLSENRLADTDLTGGNELLTGAGTNLAVLCARRETCQLQLWLLRRRRCLLLVLLLLMLLLVLLLLLLWGCLDKFVAGLRLLAWSSRFADLALRRLRLKDAARTSDHTALRVCDRHAQRAEYKSLPVRSGLRHELRVRTDVGNDLASLLGSALMRAGSHSGHNATGHRHLAGDVRYAHASAPLTRHNLDSLVRLAAC